MFGSGEMQGCLSAGEGREGAGGVGEVVEAGGVEGGVVGAVVLGLGFDEWLPIGGGSGGDAAEGGGGRGLVVFVLELLRLAVAGGEVEGQAHPDEEHAQHATAPEQACEDEEGDEFVVVQDPAQAAEAGDDADAGVVELHLRVCGRLDGEVHAVGDVGARFACEFDVFEHGDFEDFAFFAEAEDVPGEGGEGVGGGDEGRGVG